MLEKRLNLNITLIGDPSGWFLSHKHLAWQDAERPREKIYSIIRKRIVPTLVGWRTTKLAYSLQRRRWWGRWCLDYDDQIRAHTFLWTVTFLRPRELVKKERAREERAFIRDGSSREAQVMIVLRSRHRRWDICHHLQPRSNGGGMCDSWLRLRVPGMAKKKKTTVFALCDKKRQIKFYDFIKLVGWFFCEGSTRGSEWVVHELGGWMDKIPPINGCFIRSGKTWIIWR